jgi:hypothetical protein
MNPVTEDEILADIKRERERQDKKWGQQNHKDGTGVMYVPPQTVFSGGHGYLTLSRRMRRIVNRDAEIQGQTTWLNILLEEVLEAAACDDMEELDDELNQIAAVVVQWRAAIQRRRDAMRGV